jgi:hypothetical protein
MEAEGAQEMATMKTRYRNIPGRRQAALMASGSDWLGRQCRRRGGTVMREVPREAGAEELSRTQLPWKCKPLSF